MTDTGPREHIVSTTHVQRLGNNAMRLVRLCHGAGHTVPYAEAHPENPASGNSYTIDALEKAAADFRHAADEADAERLSLKGWPQT